MGSYSKDQMTRTGVAFNLLDKKLTDLADSVDASDINSRVHIMEIEDLMQKFSVEVRITA